MRVIDEMPTLGQVRDADPATIVLWHLRLRPTMSNAELDVVKAIARRYDALPASEREAHAARLHTQERRR